jgi:hypothetical protein
MYKRSLGFKDVGMARRNCVGNSRLCIHYLRHLDFEVTKHTNRRKAVFFIIGKASDLCDNTSMELIPIHFFDQPIEPIFDTPPALEKSPDCPNGFVWDGKTYRAWPALRALPSGPLSEQNVTSVFCSTPSLRNSWRSRPTCSSIAVMHPK